MSILRSVTVPVLLALLAAAALAAGEADTQPPSITYDRSRTSTENLALPGGVNVGVDKGIEWQGVKVYLSLTCDLVGVDAKTGKTLWGESVSGFWNQMTFKEVETEPGKKVWAIALRARKDDDPEQKAVEYRDLKTGGKLDLPGVSRPTGQPFTPRPAGGRDCAVGKRFLGLISTQENYAALAKRLFGPPDLRIDCFDHRPPRPLHGWLTAPSTLPPVDFSKDVALVYLLGDSDNITGILCAGAYEDDARILLRLTVSGMQTGGRFGGGILSRPYGVFIVPRREGKAYVVEQNHQSYIGGPPLWKEVLRLEKISAPANELAALVPSCPAGLKPELKLPPDFQRKIEKFRTPPPKKDDDGWGDFGGKAEYEYYVAPDGQKVPHGLYRNFRGDGKDERNEWSGAYEDGVPHGVWRQWHGRDWNDEMEDRPDTPQLEFSLTYRYGQLHGPVAAFNKDGKPDFKGQYDQGKADGVWTIYDSRSGKAREEETFDHGLWHGPTRRYSESGAKVEELNFVKGQQHGPYTRWYENGQVALKGEYIAGELPPPIDFDMALVGLTGHTLTGPTAMRSDNPPLLGMAGYRHGEWARYARDGKELWRGTFDHGTGDFVEFLDDGAKRCEARFVNGVRRGAFKLWDPAGWLERTEDRGEDGVVTIVTFYENGGKHFETEWRNARKDGVERCRDRDGNLEAECEYRNGQPWNGEIVYTYDTYEGMIVRYSGGKQVTAPPRYTKEAQARRDREARLVKERARRGFESHGRYERLPTIGSEERALDKRVNALVDALATRADQARAELLGIGVAAVPALASRLYDRNPAMAREVRGILSQFSGKPGKVVEGVTLSALVAGRPQPGECVPLWITLTNTTADDLYVFQRNWSLSIDPHGSRVITNDNTEWHADDFFLLPAGKSHGELMDAEPAEFSLRKVRVALLMDIWTNIRNVAPGTFFAPPGNWIEADCPQVLYAEEKDNPPHMDEVCDLGERKRRAAAETALLAAGAKAIPALRRGLCLGDLSRRWQVFKFACGHPHAEMEDDVVAFWGRWCNNWVFGPFNPGEQVLEFSHALPEARRLLFFDRIVAACPQDTRAISAICHVLSGGNDEEQARAWTYCEQLYERGDREYSRLNFLAWQYARGNPAARRNPALALERARQAVQAKADHWDAWHTLATVLLDSGKLEEALKAAERAVDLKEKPEYKETLETILKKLGREKPKADKESAKRDGDF